MYDPKNPQSVEKYSSAVTLSDMEIFVFPELMYSLVLANVMSPVVWRWRDDSWFSGMHKYNSYRKLVRTKQFIMDNFVFNLDLDTWGLTTKEKELARFADFIDEKVLSRSNALFGYEGDKYYFDIDIRRHFGLDKYVSNIIPYWKTETVEAMVAFKHKQGYPSGAGECVSLATLYAAALYVLAEIPLDNIYCMATPLHSQNFIDIKDGVLTNNRRIVTKNMWYNGSEISAKARRALENEQVTVVAHNTGYIHSLFDTATMDPAVYKKFTGFLRDYLKTDITFTILASFLRQNNCLQKCFQIAHSCCGKPRYIEMEKVFHYEHSSKSRVGENTQTALLHEIDEDEYYPHPLPDRIILDELESFFKNNHIPSDSPEMIDTLKSHLHHHCYNVEEVVRDLLAFCHITPRLPAAEKQWHTQPPIVLNGCKSREDVIASLESIRGTNSVADLAFTAFRDMQRAPWKPFLKAAMQRNPVCIEATKDFDTDQVYNRLDAMENVSIYDSTRMAQPDEVWNYHRGDGLEKALAFMNIVKAKQPQDTIELRADTKKVYVAINNGKEYLFHTQKEIPLPAENDFMFS